MATGLKISTESLGSDIEKIATSIRNIRAYMTVIRNAAVALTVCGRDHPSRLLYSR